MTKGSLVAGTQPVVRATIAPQAGNGAMHQARGEIATGKGDGSDQPPCDGGARGHEVLRVRSPEAAEIEPIARHQHVHRERQQHSGDRGAAENQSARKKGRVGHGAFVG